MSRHLSLSLCVVNAAVLLSFATVALSTLVGLRLVPESLQTALALGTVVAGAVLALAMLIACRRDKSLSAAERRRWELWLLVGGALTSFVYFVRQARKGA
jgi:hypothetical protein